MMFWKKKNKCKIPHISRCGERIPDGWKKIAEFRTSDWLFDWSLYECECGFRVHSCVQSAVFDYQLKFLEDMEKSILRWQSGEIYLSQLKTIYKRLEKEYIKHRGGTNQ